MKIQVKFWKNSVDTWKIANGAKNGSLKVGKTTTEVLCKTHYSNHHLKIGKNPITSAEDSGLSILNKVDLFWYIWIWLVVITRKNLLRGFCLAPPGRRSWQNSEKCDEMTEWRKHGRNHGLFLLWKQHLGFLLIIWKNLQFLPNLYETW